MFRPSKWFGWNRPNSDGSAQADEPENAHSLEQLKILHNLLEKNQSVNDANRRLLVETLRQIAEILIWGDQNDSSVFDFFLEKNMLEFFLQIMRQKCGGFVCTQLLQTLNILFENIRNETSLYYLLSNNHVNSIIVHKFDFNDEEVMAYYISFLKTLSLKLNNHTIHFFFNEQTSDFPLYTEAIKFFNHSEKMVKIAVRTLTLNVFRVRESAMLKFIGNCTAAPYFTNLTWFIGNHVLDIEQSLDQYVDKRTAGSSSMPNSFSQQNLIVKLEDLVAEHLDHLHYLNDILHLDIEHLNAVLCGSLAHQLIIPLYLHSFLSITVDKPVAHDTESSQVGDCFVAKSLPEFVPPLTPPVALFLLTQAFIIFSYSPLVNQLIQFVFCSNQATIEANARKCEFTAPDRPLDEAIELAISSNHNNAEENVDSCEQSHFSPKTNASVCFDLPKLDLPNHRWFEMPFLVTLLSALNTTVEDSSQLNPDSKVARSEFTELVASCHLPAITQWIVETKSTDDRLILFTVSLIVSILNNKAVSREQLMGVIIPKYEFCLQPDSFSESWCVSLVNTLLYIIRQCCTLSSPIRVVTFELVVYLFKRIVFYHIDEAPIENAPVLFLSDHQLALLEQSCEDSSHSLKQLFYSTDKSVFLDIFEQEAELASVFQQKQRENSDTSASLSACGSPKRIWSQNSNLSLEQLFNDSSLLLPCTIANNQSVESTSLYLRVPLNEYERIRRAIKVFFVLRRLSFEIRGATAAEATEDLHCYVKRHYDAVSTLLTPADANIPKLDELIDLDNCGLNQCTLIVHYLLNPSRFEMGYDWRDSAHSSQRRWASSVPGSRSDSPSNLPRKRLTRFIVISTDHLVVIEPDSKHYNNGRVRFIARLQDLEIWTHAQAVTLSTNPDVRKEREDNKSFFLFLRRYRASSSMLEPASCRQNPSIIIRCLFEDTIRFYAAKQHLAKAQNKIRTTKMFAVSQLIDLNNQEFDSKLDSPPSTNGRQIRHSTGRSQTSSGRMTALPGGAVSLASTKPKIVGASLEKGIPQQQPRKKLKNPKDLLECDEHHSIPMSDLSPKVVRKSANSTTASSSSILANSFVTSDVYPGSPAGQETCVDDTRVPETPLNDSSNSGIMDV